MLGWLVSLKVCYNKYVRRNLYQIKTWIKTIFHNNSIYIRQIGYLQTKHNIMIKKWSLIFLLCFNQCFVCIYIQIYIYIYIYIKIVDWVGGGGGGGVGRFKSGPFLYHDCKVGVKESNVSSPC